MHGMHNKEAETVQAVDAYMARADTSARAGRARLLAGPGLRWPFIAADRIPDLSSLSNPQNRKRLERMRDAPRVLGGLAASA
jgi:hypothetical protein